jgi:hypothetical protein
MNTIVSPSVRGPLFLDAASAELDSLLQSPFHDMGSDELLEELWEEGANREFKLPSYCPKDRGSSFVLSVWQIPFNEIVYRELRQELRAFEPQDPGEIDKAEGGVEFGSAVGRSPY